MALALSVISMPRPSVSRARGVADVEVRADVLVSMHGRAARRLVDPGVDLAAEHQGLGPKGWIRRSS